MLKEIGKRISERRKVLGYTQEQVAEMMDVSVQMISNLERGNKAIKIDNLLKISSILGVSTDYILKGVTTDGDSSDLAKAIASLPEKDYRMIELLVDYCTKKSD